MRMTGKSFRLSTFVAICSLGAAIGSLGAATALLDVLVLHPVRIEAPDRVLHLSGAAQHIPGHQADEWWAQADAFSAVALYSAREAPVEVAGTRGYAAVALVSKRFFEVMRHRPAAGRLLDRADAAAVGMPAVVVSPSFANAHIGSVQRAIGAEVSIAGVRHAIVGVVDAGAEFPRVTDLWVIGSEHLDDVLVGATSQRPSWSGMSGGAVGRLTDVGTPDAAASQLAGLLARLTAEVTPRTNLHFGTLVRVRPLRELLAQGPMTAVVSFLGASLLGLVLAALNCGLLVMNAQAARQREWAMRQALGATPAQVRATIARQSLSWALVAALVGVGGMYGLLGLVDTLAVTSGYFVPPTTGISGLYWAVGLLSIVATAVLVAVLPALTSSRIPLAPVLNDRRPYALPTAPSWIVRGIVVSVQACAGFVMLVGAVFASRDLVQALAFESGQQPLPNAQVLALRQNPSTGGESTGNWEAVWSAASTVPGIETLAMISEVPARSNGSGVFMELEDRRAFVARRFVRGPFDRVLGISRVAGAMGDQPGGLGLSRSASVALTGGAAVSSAVRFDGFPEPWRVDAVLEDLRFQDVEKPEELAVYLSTTQASALKVRLPSMQLLFSCVGRCDADVVRRLGEAVAPHADVVAPAVALTSLYEAAARPTRLRALVANVYAAMALLIVVAGVYTLSGAVVLGSAFESGMRLALGAQRAAVVARLVTRVCTPASLGIAAGAVLTIALGARALTTPATRPTGTDLSGAAMLLLATSVIAALVPALFLVRQPLIALLRRNG